MTTLRLLVVEDNQDNLDLLRLWLSEKYLVFGYGCANEALSSLETTKPDLLLLDIGMGPIDGVACLKAIRAIPAYGSTPAIALTGYARESEREAFQAAGFQVVLTKPIIDEQLFAAISAVLPPLGNQTSDQSSMTTTAR